MIHIALSTPTDVEDSLRRQGYYATSGIPILINEMCWKFGCKLEKLQIKLYGGVISIRNYDYFITGQKNIAAVRDTLLSMT